MCMKINVPGRNVKSWRTFGKIGCTGIKGAPMSFVVQSRSKMMYPSYCSVVANMVERSECVSCEGIKSGPGAFLGV